MNEPEPAPADPYAEAIEKMEAANATARAICVDQKAADIDQCVQEARRTGSPMLDRWLEQPATSPSGFAAVEMVALAVVLVAGLGVLVAAYRGRHWLKARARGLFAIIIAWPLLTFLLTILLEVTEGYVYGQEYVETAAWLSTGLIVLGIWFRYFGALLLPKRPQ